MRIGCIRQDSTIPAMVRVDELLGKHLAILGTTGTGKSCTTALILRAILAKNPAAHIVLLDPHNEYATAFSEWAEVISPRNMQLPFWLLNFEEIVEVLISDSSRKAEIEILQELIPIAKARYSAGRARDQQNFRRGMIEPSRFTVDTPVPYRISDLTGLIDERMGKLENKKDLSPYRQLRSRIDNISQDGRYSFMFGSLTVYDGMTQVLSRIFRVPVNDKPITIVELTGLPTEIINVVVSVLSRMTFDFAHWSEGKVPLTLVCEEAHRYVPAAGQLGFEPCKRAIAKIAKEGRKYGVALCIVSQRPSEIDPTILSQCNTVFALRMSNDRDQEIVNAAITDTGSGLLEFLPALGQREALAFGDGVALPVRIKFDELPAHCLPRSTTARFTEHWQKSVGDEGFLEQVVEKWRSSDIGAGSDATQHAAMMADGLGIDPGPPAPEPPRPPAAASRQEFPLRRARARGGRAAPVSGRAPTRSAGQHRGASHADCAQGHLRQRPGEPATPTRSHARGSRQRAAAGARRRAQVAARPPYAAPAALEIGKSRGSANAAARRSGSRRRARALWPSPRREIGPEDLPRSSPSCAQSAGS